MYAEEYLPQDDVYMNDMEEISVSVNSEEDSDIIQMKLINHFKKTEDVGYKKYKFFLSNNKQAGLLEMDKKVPYYKVESYSTILNCNARIRHAITGFMTHDRAGSKDELKYFSVMDTLSTSKEPRKLYYNSPEEYERHFKVNVNQSVKNDWYERKITIRSSQK